MFNLLTEKDKSLIQEYIKQYSHANNSAKQKEINLEHILRFWSTYKSEYLKDIFKNNLIIKIPICYKESDMELYEKMEKILRSSDAYKSIQNALNLKYHTTATSYFNEDYDPEARVMWRAIAALISPQTLSRNKVIFSETVNIPLNNGKKVRISKEAKPMRIIKKLCEDCNIPLEVFEQFRNEHSMCLNQKILEGELCLSIHPLDYMTMSDNSNGWSSCMSWQNAGEYRQGTVEMMNSASVVVGYLTSKNSTYISDQAEWNSKKWRCLFIVDPQFICSIKAYPYYNDNLTKTAIAELVKLSNWGNNASSIIEYNKNNSVIEDKCSLSVDFTTDYMYNDFGSDQHYICFNKSKKRINMGLYNYSGPSECVVCGSSYIDTPDTVCCDECDDCLYCSECGERLREDEVYYIQNTPFCECCHDDLAEWDAIKEEYAYQDDLNEVFISTDNECYIPFTDTTISFYTNLFPNYQETYEWKLRFKNAAQYDDKTYCYFIGPDSLTNWYIENCLPPHCKTLLSLSEQN